MKDPIKIPTQVYAEMTPNPATMKFVTDRMLVKNGNQVNITDPSEAKKYAPLADELFNFPFVKGVFFSANFVTITKDESLEWEMILQQLRTYIREWLVENEWAVLEAPEMAEEMPSESQQKTNNNPLKPNFVASEFDEKIASLLNEYVRPAVEQDGGAIDYCGFDNGDVYVELKGACNGCPSSTQTLKGGIERLLKAEIPEVNDVIAV